MIAYLVDLRNMTVIGKYNSITVAKAARDRVEYPVEVVTATRIGLRKLPAAELTVLLINIQQYKGRCAEKVMKAMRRVPRDIIVLRVCQALRDADWSNRLQVEVRTKRLEPKNEIKPARRKSTTGKLIKALSKGATLEELEAATGYPAARIWKDYGHAIRRRGYGREFRDGRYWLLMPDGMHAPWLR